MARRKKTRPRWLVAVLVLLVCGIAGAVAAVVDLLVVYPRSAGPGRGAMVEVLVPAGVGPGRLAQILEDGGAIDDRSMFELWLRLGGGLPGVRAGEFALRDDLTPAEVLEAISGRGVARGNRVTIPEGFTLNQIAGALEDAGVASIESFGAAAGSDRLLAELGIPGRSAEGYLFPDTYFFEPKASADSIVQRMHMNFRDKIGFAVAAKGPHFKDVVTLASIVQAEARVADEMPVIAGVYTNRLTSPEFRSRLLQADPTVAYGCEPGVTPRAPSCEGFVDALTRRQLEDPENPYNTYKHPGLPPGPICAPGLDALRAALEPKKVPYFYFVARDDGRHEFSVTLEEHQRAVARFRDGGG